MDSGSGSSKPPGETEKSTTSSAPPASGLFGSAPASAGSPFAFPTPGSGNAQSIFSTAGSGNGPSVFSSANTGNNQSKFANSSSGTKPSPFQDQSSGNNQSVFGKSSSILSGGAQKPASSGLFGELQSSTAGGSSSETPMFGASKPPSTSGTSSTTPAAGDTASSAAGGFGGASGDAASSTGKPALSMFGGKLNTDSSAFTKKPRAELGTPPTSNTPTFTPTATGLFGNNAGASSGSQASTAAVTPAKPSLQLASTTPAGPPPADAFNIAGAGKAQEASSAPSGGLFGQAGKTFSNTGTSVFGSGTPTGSGAPSSSGLFSKPATSGGSLFGAAAASSKDTPNPATSSTAAGGAASLFGSAKPPASDQTTSAAPAAPSIGGGLFGNTQTSTNAAAAKPSSTEAAPAAATPTAAATSGSSLFGAKPTTSASTGSTLFGAQPTSQSADKSTPSAKPAGQSGTPNPLGASTSGPTSQIPRLKNKTMEDIVTRWASDLSKYQAEFKEQATTVSAWDRSLVANGEKIQKLYLDTFEAERASHEIERQLVAVESQQDELEAWLDRYEAEVQEMFVKQVGPGEQLAGPDQERERTYKLAEKLTQQLDEKSRDLFKMVKEINDISGTLSKGAKSEDPVSSYSISLDLCTIADARKQLSQVVRVLNGHLTQLQLIDANAAALQAKVAAAQKSSVSMNNHYGGAEHDAAESFYRSYMGRR